MPPRDKIKYPIVFLNGLFPEAELYIVSCKCKECKVIDKKIKIDTYKHPGFDMIEDSYHQLRLYGAYRE